MRAAESRPRLTCRSTRDLGDLSDAWDDLVASMSVPSPFLRSWWLAAVSDDTTVFVLVHDDAGALLGGLSLRGRRRLGTTVYRFAGSGPLCPDHLDVVARPEDADDVAAAVTGWLRRQGSVVMELDGLVEGSAAARAWGPAHPRDRSPYRRLVRSDDYAEALSSSTRTSLKRAARRLASLSARHQIVGEERLADALAAFERLQADRPGREHLVAAMEPLTRAVHAGHQRGEVRVDVMEGDEVLAVMLSFVVAGRISMYQVARSTEKAAAGAGNVLMHDVFLHAATSSALVEIDMLRGDEAYKYKYVDCARQLCRLRWGCGIPGRVLARGWDGVTSARHRLHAARQRFADRSEPSRRLAAP